MNPSCMPSAITQCLLTIRFLHRQTLLTIHLVTAVHSVPAFATSYTLHLAPDCLPSLLPHQYEFINSSSNNNSVQLLANSEEGENKEQEQEEQEEVLSAPECKCKKAYVRSGNSIKMLYLMCIGLSLLDSANEEPLFSFDHEPWSQLPKTPVFRPRNDEFVKEDSRRVSLLKIAPVPCPKNWTRSQAMDWLSRNPISAPTDAEFLQMEVTRVRSVLVLSQQQEKQQQESVVAASGSGVSSGRNWRGVVPYLRLILTITLDVVKAWYLTRENARTRQELDGPLKKDRQTFLTSVFFS